ncbi:MAG TPA: hypothetical protein VGG39_27935 [Polyangiaceae bacterium]|jgi:hypothetical protein
MNDPVSYPNAPIPIVARPSMSPEDKARFLSEHHTLAGIRTVARNRRVPPEQWGEVVQQSCTRAWRTRLPPAPDEARMVMNRIAALVSRAVMTPALLGMPVPIDDVGEEELSAEASDPVYDAELRQQMQQLFEKTRARFPRRFEAFMASVTGRYPSLVEARERGITDGQVRKERSEVREFMRLHGQKMGIALAAALVVLVFGTMHDWTRGKWDIGPDDGSGFAVPHRRTFQPAADAGSLRQLAVKRYRDGDYEACLRDLDAAKAVDGRDDTPNEARMRANAMREIRTTDATHPMPIK